MTDTQRVTDEALRDFISADHYPRPPSNGPLKLDLAIDLENSRALAQSQAATIADLRAEVERLKADNKGLTDHLEDCVQERLDEMSIEAADFDKAVWRALCSYLKERKGFSWHDYEDGIHAEDVIEFLRAHDEAAESALAETRAKVEGLEKIVEELRPMIDADGKFNTLVWAERQPRLLAALSALPEAKPAAQAEGRDTYEENEDAVQDAIDSARG